MFLVFWHPLSCHIPPCVLAALTWLPWEACRLVVVRPLGPCVFPWVSRPNQSLEWVFFSLKSPFLRGVQWHVPGLQCHQSGWNFWLEWLGWINGTRRTCQMSQFGDGGPARCSMGPKQSLERIIFISRIPRVFLHPAKWFRNFQI